MTVTEAITAPASSRPGPAICHAFCLCDWDTALCGEDITGDDVVSTTPTEDMPCVVCLALEKLPCSRCQDA